MSFRFLPDPERYRRPRLAWLLQLAFTSVLHRMFSIEHDLPPRFRPPPGTLIISNHLRDADGPIVGALLCHRDGPRILGALPNFAMREDLFQDGALANLLYRVPRPWIHALRLIPLGWIFDCLRTHPMRRLAEFTWQDTLRLLAQSELRHCPPEQIFNRRGLEELRASLGELPARVDQINPWHMGATRVAHWGLRRLKLDALQRLAPTFRATVQRQLREFAGHLEADQNVFFVPEGGVSRDGRMGRIRAGTGYLAQMLPSPLRLLPMAVSYDPLRPGATRVIVRHGPLLHAADGNHPRQLSRTITDALYAQRVITPSHLLAQFLRLRQAPFSTDELVQWLDQARATGVAAGLKLDPMFKRMSGDQLVRQRLRWLRGKHLVRQLGCRWQRTLDTDAEPGWLNRSGTVLFLANALEDVAPQLVHKLRA